MTASLDQFRIEIKEFLEIPISRVTPNPVNPRPDYTLAKNDRNILSMADSIRTTGQHRPAMVYELVDHYQFDDNPGHYILLQGERRYTACVVGEIDTLSAFVVKTPQSEAEELYLLGCEDTFKVDWGTFAVFAYAHRMADALGISVTDPEIRNRTGLTADQLKDADKLFRLEPEIYALVADYEKIRYESADGARRVPGRQRHGIAGEFSVTKAVLIYDIFNIIRSNENYNHVAKHFSDYELQFRLASKRAATDALSKFKTALLDNPERPEPGVIAALAKLLDDDKATPKDFIKTTGSSEVAKLKKFEVALEKYSKVAISLVKAEDQLGNNVDFLNQVQLTLSRAIRNLERLESKISSRVKDIEGKN